MYKLINSQITKQRVEYVAGDTLADDEIPLNVGTFHETLCKNLTANVSIKIGLDGPLPSGATVAVSIIDNNALIDNNKAYKLLTYSLSDTEEGGIIRGEFEVEIVEGDLNLALLINGSDPVLTDDLTITYEIIGRKAIYV